MYAGIYKKYGDPEVVRVEKVPDPLPQEDEILIKVITSTVNRTDCGFRSAEYFISRLFSGLLRPKHQVLGCEFAGIVIEVGANCTRFKKGDQVFGYDDEAFGGHAELKVISEDKAVGLIPDGVSFEQAAALTEGSHYALGNIRAAKVKSGDKVLVYGATGAIGSAAVQLLKHFGAFVVAVSNTKNIGLVKSLGADEVIDYQTADFRDTPHQFEFIFDAVGKSSFRTCKPLLRPKGIYISTELGKNWENLGYAFSGLFSSGKKVLFPIPSMKQEDVELLSSLAERGSFRPVIDREFTLQDLVKAHTYVETGQKTGNVIIKIQDI